MTAPLPIPEREAEAKREIGVTDLSRKGARILLAGLILFFLLGTLVQIFVDTRVLREFGRLPALARDGWTQSAQGRLFRANRMLLQGMNDWEDDLEDSAWFHAPLLKLGQPILWQLGSGNGKAVRGRDGWLLYQADIDYVVGPGFDIEPPLRVIEDLRAQLAERGIELLLLPTALKPQLHPEALTRQPMTVPLRNPSEEAFYEGLRHRGIPYVEVTEGPYLLTDTHWTPETMRRVAGEVATEVETQGWLRDVPRRPVTLHESEVTHLGDIAEMLSLPEGQTLIAPETIRHVRVEIEPGDETVLVLGDSFSNIFSLEGMGWGQGGGFADHLAATLERPVRPLLRNDAGASATREMLARDLARGVPRLDGIRVVVWQFATRELAFGDWTPIELPQTRQAPAPRAEGPGELLNADRSLRVTAVVAEMSAVPRPATVTYADHVATVLLRDVQSGDGTVSHARAVARVLSMKDREWLPPARWRPGDRVHVDLVPFIDVEGEFGSLNTSVLDDIEYELVEPFWIQSVFTAGGE